MRRTRLLLLCALLCPMPAFAQFSADYQTNVISGVVSNWSGDYIVGSNAVFDLLRIESGGVLSNVSGYIGRELGADNNTVVVSGNGSLWTNAIHLFVGYAGAASHLTISNGGAVVCGQAWVGNTTNSNNNTILVSGSNSVWSMGFADIGQAGTGNQLVVTNGGKVYCSSPLIQTVIGGGSGNSSSNNLVSISGAGSVWSAAGDLYVGALARNNQLLITDGAVVNDQRGFAGNADDNVVLVSGSGSIWSNQQDLFVGSFGANNQVVITNGGAVYSGVGYVGYSRSNNVVLVTGSGSVWQNQRDLTIGRSTSTSNQLTVADSGSVFAGNVYVSSNSTAKGNAMYVVGGSLYVTGGSISVGHGGTGEAIVSNGTVQAYAITVGSEAGSQGTLSVAGNASVSAFGLTMGNKSNSTGTVWVLSGFIDNPGGMNIGNYGVGNFTMSEGTLQVRTIAVGENAGSSGTLTIAGGSTIFGSGFFGHVALEIGASINSRGTAWIKGGQLDASATDIIVSTSGSGTMVVSNGVVLARGLAVGRAGGGESQAAVAGGTCNIYSNLTIGNSFCLATGTMTVTSGSLFVTNAAHDAVLEVRSGKFTMSGGSVVVDRLVVTNACGHFVHSGGNLLIGSLVLDTALDTDGDGLPNGWEQNHGLDPLALDANADTDGDGLSNLQEFLAGTDPTNSASVFAITAIAPEGDDLRVTWTMGSGKTNALQTAVDLAGNFTDFFTVTNTVGTVTNYLDVGAATNAPARYYRVRLVP